MLDVNRNGVVEPAGGDKVWIFFGTGRGGDHYYALDVTNRNSPRHMWTPSGPRSCRASARPGLRRRWRAVSVAPARMRFNLVLVLSGGYDLTQDNDQVATLYNTDTLAIASSWWTPRPARSCGSQRAQAVPWRLISRSPG